jgi:anti-sigma B factor antagonist
LDVRHGSGYRLEVTHVGAEHVGVVMVAPRTDLLVDEVERVEGRVVLTVAGELDIGTVGRLRAAVDGAVRPGIELTLDMSRVTFCDSTGLAALVRIFKRLTADGGRLVLRSPAPRMLNLLTVTGLSRVLTVRTADEP